MSITDPSAAELGVQVRTWIAPEARDERNLLAADYTAGGTTLAFKYPLRGITPGATLSVGLNTFYVWATDEVGQTATVDGGTEGSVDSDAMTGADVLVRPRLTGAQVSRYLNDELADLSAPGSGLYRMRTATFTPTGSTVGYDLAGVTDLQQVYEVRYVDSSGYQLRDLPRLKPHEYRLERATDTGFRFMLLSGGRTGYPVTVLYKSGFDPLLTADQLVSSTGLPTTAVDVLTIGAALRGVVGREVRRNETRSQGDTRRAEEVPAGAQQASWRGLAGLRATRLAAEVSRLQAAYPPLQS